MRQLTARYNGTVLYIDAWWCIYACVFSVIIVPVELLPITWTNGEVSSIGCLARYLNDNHTKLDMFSRKYRLQIWTIFPLVEWGTVYPKKYTHGFVVLCFVVVMQLFIMNSHEVLIHIHQGCFAGTGAIVRLPQCQWSKPDGYGKISQCITTTKHSKAKTVWIFLGIYCMI